jgi:predicted MPP superfamily phosphohydrolase
MLFVVLFLSVIALANGYLWWRLVRDTRLARPASYLATSLIIALAASVPLALAVWAGWSRSYAPLVNTLAFSWLGVSFYLVLLLMVADALRWLRLRSHTRAAAESGERASLPATAALPELETRRVFVARSIAGGALLAAGGIGVSGVRSALWDITTPELNVVLPKLPRELDGFSIALLTDVHIGPLLDGRFLRQLVEKANQLRPDMIAICGDLVDGNVAQIGQHVAELRGLRSKYGTYFVTGNHEYYVGAGPWIEFLQRLGVQVLVNRRLSIGDASRAGASFDLVGVPDVFAGRSDEEEPALARTLAGRDPERELVVLAHQPVQIYQSAGVGAGLQLSGHTHGGQLFPFGALACLSQPYLAGLYRHEASDTQIYVSRGSGFWGPPMRVLAPAEISLLRLSAG